MGTTEVEHAIKTAELNEAFRKIVGICKDMACENTPKCDNFDGKNTPCKFRDKSKARGCLKPIIIEVLKTARGIPGENEELFANTPLVPKRRGRPRRTS